MTQLSLFDPIEIQLTRGYVAIVDPVDVDLAGRKWYAGVDSQCVYAKRRYVPHVSSFLHRIILERMLGRALLPGEFCDHINGDGLDNRRCNLRVATSAENNRNKQMLKSNTSGYKGVKFHKNARRWCASIMVNYKNIHLGYFDTPEQAYVAYCEAAKHYFGQFARLD